MAFKAISLNDALGKIEKVKAGSILEVEGGVSIGESLVVAGDLTVSGNVTSVSTTELQIQDAMIDLGMEDDGNGGTQAPTAAGAAQVGIRSNYWDGAAAAVASLYFKPSDQKWYLDPGVLVSDLEGNASSATILETARTFEISGDVVAAAVSFDGSGNVNLVATVQPDSVELGTDTTGAYVESLAETSPYLALVDASPLADGAQLSLSLAADSANTADTVVARDASGDFSANHITAARFIGLADEATILETARDFSMSGDVVAAAVSFDGSGNVTLSSTIQAGAVEFSMMDAASYRDSVETIRPSLTASDTEFATEKAISILAEQVASEAAAQNAALRYVAIGSSNQAAPAPLAFAIEDFDASLTDADYRLASNHGKRMGFAVTGTASDYMVITANGTAKDMEWSLDIEEDYTNFATGVKKFASVGAIVDYVQDELSIVVAANALNIDGDLGTQSILLASESLKLSGTPNQIRTDAQSTDEVNFSLAPDVEIDGHMTIGAEYIQHLAGVPSSVAAYSFIKPDMTLATQAEFIFGMSAGASVGGDQLIFTNGQVVEGPAMTGFAAGDRLFLSTSGSITNNQALAQSASGELVQVGYCLNPAANVMFLDINHILTM